MFQRSIILIWILGFMAGADAAAPVGIKIIEVQPPAEISRDGGKNWDAASPQSDTLKPGHRLRTGEKGRVKLEIGKDNFKTVGELSSLVVPEEGSGTRMKFFKGIGYFFNRDKPGETEVEGPMTGAVVRGTEFVFEVDDEGISKVTVLEGSVTLTNAFGEVTLEAKQAGRASTKSAPERLPVLVSDMPGTIQWALYYPGVLDMRELDFSAADRQKFAAAIEAYEAGDLRAALIRATEAGVPGSPAGELFVAALDLRGGRAAQTRAKLNGLDSPPAQALQWLMDAVQFKVRATELPQPKGLSASQLLALSYARQSVRDVRGALEAARFATFMSPKFGFAWARVAELEFSFGNAEKSAEALAMARKLAPRNAQAAALQGFVLAAQNRTAEALTSFEQAIELDGALANGWLGTGLIRIRRGDEEGGRKDLLIAAASEPQRAFLRSYLGKALDLAGNTTKARHELELAKELDPSDPTPWLYGALLNQNANRINDAVRDVETSQTLVTNRAVYRSEFKLDEDRAVRGAHLASIYRDAGMQEHARHEAANSVTANYANASSHLFLAESYLSLDRVNLRYEGARVSEYLIANLLSPAGSGAWSPAISQQEYSALFERDGGGLVSSTEYRSNGRWLQSAAGFVNWRGSSVSLDGLYLSDPGFRPNNDLQISTASFQYKQQITPQDTLYVQPLWSSVESGDLVDYYSDTFANPNVRVRERQEPIFLAGWRHDWSPQNKTIVLGSYLNNDLRIDDPSALLPRIDTPLIGDPMGYPVRFDNRYRSEFEAWSAEVQQIMETRLGDTIVGGLAQLGTLDATSVLNQAGPDFPPLAPRVDRVEGEFERFSVYAYQSWNPIDWFELVGGLSYDRMEYPGNFRLAPLAPGQESRDQLSPKGGFAARVWKGATLRGAYAQSLGGVGFDQSFRIEPSQVAGINQRFRSMVPEAMAGSNAGERMEMGGLDFSQQLGSNTWVNVSALWLSSYVSRTVGLLRGGFPATTVDSAREEIEFRERSLQLTVNRLIGRDFAVGASYAVGEAAFSQSAPGIFETAARDAGLATAQESVLQQGTIFGTMNHPSGFFLRAEGIWTHQSNRLDVSGLVGDDFWQGNVFGGYRFAKRRAEIGVGLLNVTDERYKLHPLNLHSGVSKERTAVVSFKWSL